MFKIFISSKVKGKVNEILLPHCEVIINPYDGAIKNEEIKPLISDVHGVIWVFGKMNKELIDSAPLLKVICCYGVGYNRVDVNYATSKGIVVLNLPEVVTESTAELTWALLLSVTRRIPEADRFVRRQEKFRSSLELLVGKQLFGKRLGIIGMGRIGATVAKKAIAFNMETVYYDILRNYEVEKINGIRYMNLEELISTSDIISIHLSLTPETFHFIDEDEFDRMKPDAIIINASRGPIVNEAALINALLNKKISGAGLDVYENEPCVPKVLRTMDNVVLTPHIGTATFETHYAMTELACKSILAVLQGKKPYNVVNPLVYSQKS